MWRERERERKGERSGEKRRGKEREREEKFSCCREGKFIDRQVPLNAARGWIPQVLPWLPLHLALPGAPLLRGQGLPPSRKRTFRFCYNTLIYHHLIERCYLNFCHRRTWLNTDINNKPKKNKNKNENNNKGMKTRARINYRSINDAIKLDCVTIGRF